MARGQGPELTKDRVDRAHEVLRDRRYDRSRQTAGKSQRRGSDRAAAGPRGQYTWTGDWKDLEQVRPYFDQFKKIKDGEGLFYNDDFRGRIEGLAGPDEDRGIYLLQKLHRQERNQGTIAAALADGHHDLKPMAPDEPLDRQKFASIYVLRDQGQQIFHYEDARLVYDEKTRQPYMVLPKRKRSHGYQVWGSDQLVVKT